jgi:hypothetical protein
VWWWRKEQPEPEPANDPFSGVQDETVNALLAGVHYLIAAEESRAESLNGRATGITGFVALVVTAAAALSRVPSGHVGGTTRGIAVGLFLVAVAGFLVAIVVAMFQVLVPSPGLTVADEEIDRYPTYAWITRRPVEVQGHRMRAGIATLKSERERNDHKARWLKRAYVAVLLGVVCLAGDGLILLHSNAGSERNTPRQHTPARATGGGASTAQRLPLLRPGDGGDSARA